MIWKVGSLQICALAAEVDILNSTKENYFSDFQMRARTQEQADLEYIVFLFSLAICVIMQHHWPR